ncbi:hypothetical protein KI688_004090 [Linnemannia hyalina]|uniref:C2H2-type domain-containing protein n=1 Tax=Linnemannia hyalina TaxID=64524 RepID=A0A9P7XQS1_9FUNG|nr:hypothetical protein KI688_004090 [Linnemannia hyalina]
MPKDYYGRGDYSDDESNSRSRDKFRRERSPEKDDFGRDKRRRKTSASPEDRERRPRRNRSSSKDGDDPTDRYIPNYDRDGYNPAPRHNRPDHYGGRFDGHGGYNDYRGQRRRDDGFGDMDGPDAPYGDGLPSWGGSGGGGERIDDPMKLDQLISFKLYCEYLRNVDRASHRYKRYTDEDLQSRYGTYREEFVAKQLSTFFEAHKSEAWFQEKYHPDMSKARAEESRALRKSRYGKFVEGLAAGKFDNSTCDEALAKKESAQAAEAKAEKTAGEDGEAAVDKEGDTLLNGEDASDAWLYLKAVLPTVTRASILERCEKLDGFVMLSLSEPHPLKELQRIGWIKFQAGTDVEAALTALTEPETEDFQATTAAHRPTRARYTHEIANSGTRIRADYELALAIAKVCDQSLNDAVEGEADAPIYDGVSLVEALLKDHILAPTDTPMDEAEQEDPAQASIRRANERRSLDLFIEYLRQVHLFCYYCGGDSDNAEEFSRKCSKHFRNPDTKVPVNSTKGAVWVKNLEQKLNLKLKDPTDEEITKLGGKSLEKASLKFLQGKTQQDEPTKWRCKICTKPFRGEEFVHKHIRTKHPDEIKTIEDDQQPQPSAFGYGAPGPMFSGHPMPMSFMPGAHPMGMPFMNPGMSPMPQFPPNFIPPSFSAAGAMAGTPMDQIPRIGFDFTKRRGSKEESGDKARTKQPDVAPPRPPTSMMLDPRSRMSDPRKVTSYVDLDAPAEGDLDSKYNLW